MADKYILSKKEKMLGAALYARQVSKENMLSIMMVLDGEEQVDDMLWFIGQSPNAADKELVAAAYQIAKDYKKGN